MSERDEMIERAAADLTEIYFEDIESLVCSGTWTINKTVRMISERMADFALSEIEREDAWIPVEERLPEVGQDVCFIVGGITNATYAYENGRKLGGRYSSDGSFTVPGAAYPATHWKPLR